MTIAFAALALLAGGVAPAFADEPIPCAEKSVSAMAVRSMGDVESFVQCAYEYALEMGFEEAHRAFHEDERWKSGQVYIFVNGRHTDSVGWTSLVFPPNRTREGTAWEPIVDIFGTDLNEEFHRATEIVDRGWVYYGIVNPANNQFGRNPAADLLEPKASYFISLDWDGVDAVIGAGIYRRDFPGTCHAAQVNAARAAAEQSMESLEELVRCAALEVESKGWFAMLPLTSDPRWRSGSIYLFGMDLMGNQLFSGRPVEASGMAVPEWGRDSRMMFRGRDMPKMAETFGESYVYYHAINPATGVMSRKAAFVKRVSAQGVPLLIGAGMYLPD